MIRSLANLRADPRFGPLIEQARQRSDALEIDLGRFLLDFTQSSPPRLAALAISVCVPHHVMSRSQSGMWPAPPPGGNMAKKAKKTAKKKAPKKKGKTGFC